MPPIPPDGPPPDPSAERIFRGLEAPTACLSADGTAMRFSVQLLDGNDAIRPADRLEGDDRPVGERIGAEMFGFGQPPDLALPDGTQARLTAELGVETRDVALSPAALSFAWKGGDTHHHEERMLILLVDHSGSLVGRDAAGLEHAELGSDPYDLRIPELLTHQ